jgi:hypothetical protein
MLGGGSLFFLAPKIFFIESGEIQRGRGESKKGGIRRIAIAGRRVIGVDPRKGTLKSIEGGEISAFL